jgi:uncharacterized protein (DUF302 family)
MKTKLAAIIFLVFGILVGVIITGISLNLSAGQMMVKEMKSPYDFEKTVETIVERINNKQGWHVVTVIEQDKEVQLHGGKAIGKFNIIQYCSGKYSSEMLKADNRKSMGAMLPKNLAVYEKSDGQVYVSSSNGAVMGKLFGGDTGEIVEKVSLEVEDILRFMNFKFSLF